MKRHALHHALKGSLAALVLSGACTVNAGLTDISDVPLASSSNLQVKPNVLFILDDSASMGWEYMPDKVGRKVDASDPDGTVLKSYVGFRNYQCNLIYYNPNTNYVVPVTSLGGVINPSTASTDWGSVPSTFTAALDDGYYFFDGGTLTQVNLSSAFKSHPSDTAQAAYYWTLDSSVSGSVTLEPLNSACNMALLSQTDSTTTEVCADGTKVATSPTCSSQGKTPRWKKILVSTTSGPGSTDERQNFANWYSYYRTRLNMMKSASGRAIVPLGENYRVGFMTIDPGAPVAASKYLAMGDFSTTNKANWFKKLYSQRVNDITPLLTALSRAGRYYAGKVNDGINAGITDDPVQFSCQQNFTILTTDGYWNGTTAAHNIGNSALNTNQDGDLTELDANNEASKKFLVSPRPIYDGAVRYLWKSALIDYRDNTACTYIQAQQRSIQYQTRTVQTQKRTVQNQTRTTQLQTRTTQLQKRTIQYQKKTVQNQQKTTQLQTRTTQLQETSTQLQKKTTQRQKRSIQWQKKTIQNQKKITQLQKRTTQLQETSTQLQKKTTQLQKRTVQNQSKTTQLQKKTLQLQKRTARYRACSGTSGSGSCVDVAFDCTSSTGDSSKPYCYITNDTGWTNVLATSCSPASTETSTTLCRTNDPGWVSAGSCTAASINSSGQTIQCQTNDPGWVNVGTCTAAAFNSTTGQTVTCQTTSDTGWVNVGTCSTSNPGTGPTITCQTSDPGWVNVASCTAASINASGQTVTCQTTSPATVNVGTCTVAPINASGKTVTACPTTNPSWTNVSSCTPTSINASGQTVQCQTTTTTDWTNVGTCTASSSNGQTVTCQEASNTGWVNVGSCSASNPTAGPTVTCQSTADTGWVAVGTCSASAPTSGPTITCRTYDPGWVNSGACTAAGINASGETVTCQTVGPTVTNVGTCTVAGINASGKTVTACSTTSPSWNNTGSCTPSSINASGQTVECQTVDPGWVNVGTCTPAAFSSTTGQTVTCQVLSDTGWVNVGSCSAANPSSGPTVTCQNLTDTGWVNVGACTAAAPSSGPTVTCQTTSPSWTNTGSCSPTSINASGQTVQCQTTNPGWTNIGTCNAATINASGATVECNVASDSGWVNINSCSASNPSTGPTVTCQTASDSGWVNSGTCTASSPTAGPVVTCNTASDSGWSNVASCTEANPSTGPTLTCQNLTLTGHQLQYRSTQTDRLYQSSGQAGTLYSTSVGSTSAWANTSGSSCSATVPTVPPSTEATGNGPPALPSGCAAWPCETAINTYGSNESLADVAQYYYKNDLRTTTLGNCTGSTGADVCENNVRPLGTGTEDDKATWQHMTTFTLGLGVSGSLTFQSDYKTSSTGAFAQLRAGTLDWPVPVRDSTSVLGDLVEPKYAVDDLWHAAVNGRGQYFSAGRPEDVVSGLGTALNAIDADQASGSGVAVSNQQLQASNNLVYMPSYLTKKWTGNIQAYGLNPQTGEFENTLIWDAQTKLDAATRNACDNRSIKLFRATNLDGSAVSNKLVDFTLNTSICNSAGNPTGTPQTALNSDEQAYFNADYVNSLSQSASMSSAQKTAAAGAKLVNYLRGQRGNETFVINNVDRLFRAREHVLGDIVFSAPRYVAAPFAAYDDIGYNAYKTAQASRTPMLYVGGNDGMLHAFRGGTSDTDPEGGKEAWAFIPSMLLPKLHKLASEGYTSQHSYFVDGTPTIGDVCSNNCSDEDTVVWKSILVSGLRNGGKGYFALDVTDPAQPKGLWEFKHSSTCYNAASTTPQYTDCHLGLSFGAPIIAKTQIKKDADGNVITAARWVVIVSSGYNNVNSPTQTGDGQGYLYVLDALTGQILKKISTNTGSADTPSGMAHINGYSITPLRDNTVDYVYGTDLQGNIWRFDINDIISPSGVEASRLATVTDSTGAAQPITTRPILGEVNGEPYVYVATGRYLGASDLNSAVANQTQSIWAIRDPLTSTALTGLRTTLRRITTTTSGDTRTNRCATQGASEDTDSCASEEGWFTDLPETGERVGVDMMLEMGSLFVLSNVPPASACEIGGSSWLNIFDATRGTAVNPTINSITGSRVKDSQGNATQGVGLNVIRTTTGAVKVLVTTRQGGVQNNPGLVATPQVVGKRVSWREIVE